MKISNDKLKEVITCISESFDSELYGKSQAGLEDYWHFKYDSKVSVEENMYEFYKMLELYGRMCERWESHHNGSCCVVERVRDNYLMPKIKEILKTLEFELEVKII